MHAPVFFVWEERAVRFNKKKRRADGQTRKSCLITLVPPESSASPPSATGLTWTFISMCPGRKRRSSWGILPNFTIWGLWPCTEVKLLTVCQRITRAELQWGRNEFEGTAIKMVMSWSNMWGGYTKQPWREKKNGTHAFPDRHGKWGRITAQFLTGSAGWWKTLDSSQTYDGSFSQKATVLFSSRTVKEVLVWLN